MAREPFGGLRAAAVAASVRRRNASRLPQQAAARLEAAILAEQEELVDAACLSDGHGRTRPGRLPCDRQRSAIQALYALPEAFPTAIPISDFRAADIFALRTALGASSEEAAVQGLHRCARNGTRRAHTP